MKNYISLLLTLTILLFSGCSGRIIAEGEVFYPKENQGNVWRSRAEFHRKEKQNSRTKQNMGMYHGLCK